MDSSWHCAERVAKWLEKNEQGFFQSIFSSKTKPLHGITIIQQRIAGISSVIIAADSLL
jgi:hypothetical protein